MEKFEKNSEYIEKLVHINRITKVVKGGRRFGFAAIMIVGDNKGRVGYGTGKAKEVPEAVRKATENAKNKMVRVYLKDNRTLHHDVVGRLLRIDTVQKDILDGIEKTLRVEFMNNLSDNKQPDSHERIADIFNSLDLTNSDLIRYHFTFL